MQLTSNNHHIFLTTRNASKDNSFLITWNFRVKEIQLGFDLEVGKWFNIGNVKLSERIKGRQDKELEAWEGRFVTRTVIHTPVSFFDHKGTPIVRIPWGYFAFCSALSARR